MIEVVVEVCVEFVAVQLEVAVLEDFLQQMTRFGFTLNNSVDELGFQIATQRCLLVSIFFQN